MKILQLCKKFPFPIHDGETIAITNLSKSLADVGCEIDLLAMNTSRHFADLESMGEDSLNHYNRIFAVEVDNRLKAVDAFVNLLKGRSYHISRFNSDAFRDKLAEVLQSKNYDVVQLETVYLMPYVDTIRKYSKGIISMRAHNVEHEIWEKIANNTTSIFQKWYLQVLSRQLKEYEVGHLNDVDFLIAISPSDLSKFKTLGYKNGAVSTPIGLNVSQYGVPTISSSSARKTMAFIGSLDWKPNVEGLLWFLDQIMPRLSDIELHVAGRNTPEHLLNREQENVIIHGEVPDAKDFISSRTLMVVPLLSGSGMRVKILEGMAMGKCVITTTKGAEGIHVTHGENILLADTVDEFVYYIQKAFAHLEWSGDIGKRALHFIRSSYDTSVIAAQLKASYDKVLQSDYLLK